MGIGGSKKKKPDTKANKAQEDKPVEKPEANGKSTPKAQNEDAKPTREEGTKKKRPKKTDQSAAANEDPGTAKPTAEETPVSPKKKRTKKNADQGDKKEGDEEGGDLGDELVRNQKKKVTKDDFDLLTVIGRGSFGKVMQVRYKKNNKIYAMKVMRKDAIIAKNQVTHTKDEKNILQLIAHPFIVNLHYAFQTKDKLYMILDYVNGGELFYHLKKETKFSEERVRLYAAEISSALLHLHSNGIIYRDLKPENILLDKNGHIVITDFGLSKEVAQDDATHTFCGTPEYLAPEVLRGQGHSYPVDWWSLGTLIYEMLTGLPPFYSKHINVMYQKILNAQLTFPSSMSEAARGLLEGLLTRDPEKRLGGDAVRKHPFFSGLDWEALDRKVIDPAWKPPVKSETDTTQIDDYFTNEKPADSPNDGSLLDLDEEDKDIFEGFTFQGKNLLDGAKEETDD